MTASVTPVASWKLEDAKARFSELVRRAQQDGPQQVTVRGRKAVTVIASDALEALSPSPEPFVSLYDMMRSAVPIGDIDLTREPDYGRDIDL
jgi:prevent-host-death family protein